MLKTLSGFNKLYPPFNAKQIKCPSSTSSNNGPRWFNRVGFLNHNILKFSPIPTADPTNLEHNNLFIN